MAYEFVDPPRGLSYAAPAVDFGILGDLPSTYRKAQQERRQEDIASTFKGGLPIDPATGQPDYAKAMAMLAAKGDIGAVSKLAGPQLDQALINRAGQISPLLGGPAAGGGPGLAPQFPQQAAPQQPQSLPAPPVGPPARGGGDSAGSVVDIVSQRLPQDSQKTGAVIANIARAAGVDPNAPLTPAQSARVAQLADGYVLRTGGTRAPAGPVSPVAAVPADTVNARFPALAAAGGPSGLAQIAPGGGGAEALRGAEGAAPNANAAPVQGLPGGQGAQGPIMPPVPLPPGYRPGQEQEAIMRLRSEAARRAAGGARPEEVNQLAGWADRIEKSIQPIQVGANTTLVDPRTRQVLYGPQGQSITGQALEGAGQRYYQTGQFPSGMTRDTPTNRADRLAIQQRAYDLAEADGLTPGDLPKKWLDYRAEGNALSAGARTFETRAAGLVLAENEAKGLIPRVREISQRISRTDYPDINSLILAAKKRTGNPDVVRLGIAIESLLPVYARILKPTGQITEGDTNRAHGILDKAWSAGQIDAALDQMNIELDSAKAALNAARVEYRSGTKAAPREPAGGGGAPSGGGAADSQAWTTLPGGVRIREKP